MNDTECGRSDISAVTSLQAEARVCFMNDKAMDGQLLRQGLWRLSPGILGAPASCWSRLGWGLPHERGLCLSCQIEFRSLLEGPRGKEGP